MLNIVSRRRQAWFHGGLSMVELLVALAIASGLLLLSTTLYLSGKASFRINEDKRRLYQDGNYAMTLMEKDLRQAWFGNVVSAISPAGTAPVTDFILSDGTPALGLRGCEHGFVKPLGPGEKDFSCSLEAGMAAFEVSYRSDDYSDPPSGAGVDCNGTKLAPIAVPPDHPAYMLGPQVTIARNLYFVAARVGVSANSLYCQGNGNPQPVLSNIEDLQLTYGVAAAGEATPRQFLNATQVAALSDDQRQNWERVVRIGLCLQLRGENQLTIEPQRYVDCAGGTKLASDRHLRAVFKRVVTLRNRAAIMP